MSPLKSMFYYSVAMFGLKGLSFIMLPIVTSFVDTYSYGTLNLLTSFASIASIVLALGLGETLLRFSVNEDSHVNLRLMSHCFTLSVLLVIAMYVGLVILTDWIVSLFPIEVHSRQLVWLFTSLCFSALLTVPYAHWRQTNQAQKYAQLVLAQALIQSLLTIVLLLLEMGINAVLISGAISATLCSGYVLWTFRKLLRLSNLFSAQSYWKYAIFILLASSSTYLIQGTEQWLIAAKLSAQTLAIYYIAAQLSLLVSFSIEPFKQWWFARRYQSLHDDRRSNAYYSVLGCELGASAFLCVLAIMPTILGQIVEQDYLGALDWLHWMCLLAIMKLQTDFLNIGCYVRSNGKIPFVINLISAAVLLPLAIFWVDIDGLQGIINALLIANLTRATLFFVISQNLLHQAYDFNRIIFSWLVIGSGFTAYETGSLPISYALLFGYVLYLTYTTRVQISRVLRLAINSRKNRFARSVYHG